MGDERLSHSVQSKTAMYTSEFTPIQKKLNILCYIATYNSASIIQTILERIPGECWNNNHYNFEVLVGDDSSTDDTFTLAHSFALRSTYAIKAMCTPFRIGFGGSLKLGFKYAITNEFDAIISLEGNGQHDPEQIPMLIAPVLASKADVVLGSYSLHRESVINGELSFYRFFVNVVLTKLQNIITGTRLTQYCTGYRVYSTRVLSEIDFEKNSDGYSFAAEIMLQLLDAGKNFLEITIPTHNSKVSHYQFIVTRIWQTFITATSFRLHNLGFRYDVRLSHKPIRYPDKTSFSSSHQFAIRHSKKNCTIIDLGGGLGYVAKALRGNNCEVIGFDKYPPAEASAYSRFIEKDISVLGSLKVYQVIPDTVLILDVLEHLENPEQLLEALRKELKQDVQLIVTVPNVAFINVRLKLLFGYFGYTSRGILDRTHLRFFTFTSLFDMISRCGYDITFLEGIPAPFPLILGSGRLARLLIMLNKILIFFHRGLFSFQIGVTAKPRKSCWRSVQDKKNVPDE